MRVDVKTDNGWYHIDDLKPNSGEKVLVILERESNIGCAYDFYICESIYRHSYPKDYFLEENSVWKVRYWRRKELIPYPNDVVRKEMEKCEKHNVSPHRIIEHQKMCGIEVVD